MVCTDKSISLTTTVSTEKDMIGLATIVKDSGSTAFTSTAFVSATIILLRVGTSFEPIENRHRILYRRHQRAVQHPADFEYGFYCFHLYHLKEECFHVGRLLRFATEQADS